ncbi:hypothetical protein MO973_43685 [Paenibacillus sp. TRM 82003]|nr:hypothetical protein [Paenibacillus sp. TRM 82003]
MSTMGLESTQWIAYIYMVILGLGMGLVFVAAGIPVALSTGNKRIQRDAKKGKADEGELSPQLDLGRWVVPLYSKLLQERTAFVARAALRLLFFPLPDGSDPPPLLPWTPSSLPLSDRLRFGTMATNTHREERENAEGI